MLLAREELIKLLTSYQDSSGIRVVVVFDGQGDKTSEETTPGGIQVFYAAQGQTAGCRDRTPSWQHTGSNTISPSSPMTSVLERQTAPAPLARTRFRATPFAERARGSALFDLDRQLKKFKRDR